MEKLEGRRCVESSGQGFDDNVKLFIEYDLEMHKHWSSLCPREGYTEAKHGFGSSDVRWTYSFSFRTFKACVLLTQRHAGI